MKIKFFPPKTFEFKSGQSVIIGNTTTNEINKFGVDLLKNLDNPVYEFAIKVARAMNEIKSSNVYFIMQQAYGDIEWSEVEGIFASVLEYGKASKSKTGKHDR